MDELNDLLEFFQYNNVSIQITLDVDKYPTVHAIYKKELYKTEHEDVISALKAMKKKLIKVALDNSN